MIDIDKKVSEINYNGNPLELAGGGELFREHGTISYHTGAPNKNISIPISNDGYDNYFLTMVAIKSWKYINGMWVEQQTLDFSDTESQGTGTANVLDYYFEIHFSKTTLSMDYTMINGNTYYDNTVVGNTKSRYLYTSQSSTGASAIRSHSINNNTLSIGAGWNICNAAVGLTFEYDIVGWNNE